MSDLRAEAQHRAERRAEWARLGDLRVAAERSGARLGLEGDVLMAIVDEATQIAREAIVAAELGWLEVERQDDRVEA